VELTTIFSTLSLPIEIMEMHVVAISMQVEKLEELVIPNPIPLYLLQIGVGAEITLINTNTNAFEDFKTQVQY
jgi:hypothetical protein